LTYSKRKPVSWIAVVLLSHVSPWLPLCVHMTVPLLLLRESVPIVAPYMW